jgi:small subunit ribosomal protein S16
MLTIRLQRTGKKNQADFRIVLAEKEAPVNKKFQEVLGSYNPRKKTFQVKEERVKYWLGNRVELSPTVHNLFVTKGLLEASKVKAFSVPKKAEAPQEAAPAAEAAAPEVKPAETPAPEQAPEQPAQ